MNNPFQMMLTGLIVNGGAGFAVRYATNYRNFFVRAFLGTMISTLIVAFIFLWRDTEERISVSGFWCSRCSQGS